MADVIQFPGTTEFVVEEGVEHPISVDGVIEGVLKADLKELVVVGRMPTGEIYLASSSNNLPSVLWLLEIARFNVVANGPD